MSFYLFGVGAGIDACHDALWIGEGRELVFFHIDEGIDAESYHHGNDDPDNLLVLDAAADDAIIFYLFHHCILYSHSHSRLSTLNSPLSPSFPR